MSLKIVRELWEVSLNTRTDILDRKHSEIVNNAKKIEFSDFCKSYRNWDQQSDSGIPFQINFYNFHSYGYIRYLKYLISKIKTLILFKCDEVDYFFDDLEIIKLINGYDILRNCPLHKTPGNNLAFFINKNISANVRWLRYVYFVSLIRNQLNKNFRSNIFLDIGSYYGGFQYVMKKTYQYSKHIMVDFPHQLSRAALFLTKSFPDSKIFTIYNEKTLEEFFMKNRTSNFEFLLVSTDFYSQFSKEFSKTDLTIDLATNFYSLGEMPREFFNSYLGSEIIKNSRFLYFCNRYDSSPYYEKTFQESYSIIDYLVKGFEITLNRSSGIHNYMMPIRKLFGTNKSRPISAGYFELIQKNINKNSNI